jgi:hypothetical protein
MLALQKSLAVNLKRGPLMILIDSGISDLRAMLGLQRSSAVSPNVGLANHVCFTTEFGCKPKRGPMMILIDFGSRDLRTIACFKAEFGGKPKHGNTFDKSLCVSLSFFVFSTARRVLKTI